MSTIRSFVKKIAEPIQNLEVIRTWGWHPLPKTRLKKYKTHYRRAKKALDDGQPSAAYIEIQVGRALYREHANNECEKKLLDKIAKHLEPH